MDTERTQVERFPGTGGLVMPIVAGLLVALLVVTSLVDGLQSFDVPVLTGCLLGAVVVWVVFLRPSVRVEDETLVLRGSVGETAVPLAAVERVTITRMLVVQAGARRHVSTALARTLRSTMTSGGMAAPRREASALGMMRGSGDDAARPGESGEAAHDALGRSAYPDFVEERLLHLAESARARAGVRLLSAEQEALAAGVRRVWSPAAIGALAGAGVLFVLSLLVV